MINNIKHYFTNKELLRSSAVAFLLLATSFVVNFNAGTYANNAESNSVTDIVLSNIPTFDVDGIFIYGAIALWIFVLALCLYKPSRIPFTIKSIALFVFIRSIFIILTHIGIPEDQLAIPANRILSKFSFDGDLFFSGHTGLPFLMALVFWDNKYLRYLFIFLSLMFGAVVLMAHLHYSIDVLSAFFITYTIYHISGKIFKKDKGVFASDLQDKKS